MFRKVLKQSKFSAQLEYQRVLEVLWIYIYLKSNYTCTGILPVLFHLTNETESFESMIKTYSTMHCA